MHLEQDYIVSDLPVHLIAPKKNQIPRNFDEQAVCDGKRLMSSEGELLLLGRARPIELHLKPCEATRQREGAFRAVTGARPVGQISILTELLQIAQPDLPFGAVNLNHVRDIARPKASAYREMHVLQQAPGTLFLQPLVRYGRFTLFRIAAAAADTHGYVGDDFPFGGDLGDAHRY